MAMESGGQDPIDFTNNAWFPNASVWWSSTGGSYSSLAQARAGLAPTTPVFGTSTHRHDNDVISESDPFQNGITLGPSYLTQITTAYTRALSTGSVAHGAGMRSQASRRLQRAAPDVGAIITGAPAVVWGDRDTGSADTVPPSPPSSLIAR
jgi:hypothetical protein